MLRIFKCLLLPLLLAVVTQSSTVIAESIRLTGPDNELRATSRYSDLASGQRRNVNEPSRFYGPTTSQETLWSIASRYDLRLVLLFSKRYLPYINLIPKLLLIKIYTN